MTGSLPGVNRHKIIADGMGNSRREEIKEVDE
jgi:hypothetical protein